MGAAVAASVERPPLGAIEILNTAPDADWKVAQDEEGEGMTDYSSLRLWDIVMHQVTVNPEKGGQKFVALTTDAPVTLATEDRRLITKRFTLALAKGGSPVIQDTDSPSPVPAFIRSLWDDDEDYVEVTRKVAHHLAQIQPLTSGPGLLVIARAGLTDDENILVAKVEHQEAMRIEPRLNDAGQRVIDVQRLKELVFGDAAKIYKIALLSKSASSLGSLAGDLADDQNGAAIAAYYLGKFMGMKMRDEPAVLTERYLHGMGSVINASTLSPEEKADVQSALLADLRSNATQIDLKAFIRTHVPVQHQRDLGNKAAELGITGTSFTKETSRVRKKLERLRLDLSNDVHIVAPAESIGAGKDVQVESETDEFGHQTVTVSIKSANLDAVRANGTR